MIKSIKINNFKSLVGFECELNKFSCLIGLNGAGKSTILQALDFLSQLMRGDVESWLLSRQWDKSDLNSRLTSTSNIDFTVIIEDDLWGCIQWEGSFNRKYLNCTKETVYVINERFLNVEDGKYNITTYPKGVVNRNTYPVVFKYSGSVLSSLIDSQLSPPLLALKNQLLQLKSLDLLAPDALRQRSRASDKDLGLGGEKLSAFLSELTPQQKQQLIEKLKTVYPAFEQFQTQSLKSGWKKLSINERFNNESITTEARHINDGLLRLMAILAQTQTEHSFLLFDEIENGINPELVEQLVHWLVDAPQQILVTTHSPMILNYLDDETAIKGVLLVYKTPEGYTRCQRFFEIPAMAEKLSVLGAGEVFIDTDLVGLVAEINRI
jgi:predicted ATPase